MIKAIIFDMGGVLLRTLDEKPRENMAKRFGISRKRLEQFVFSSPTSLQSELGKLSDFAHWQVVLDHFNQQNISPEEAYYEFFSGDAVDQELLDFARSLKPDLKVTLLSNAWKDARRRLGALYDFIDVFDMAVFSAEVGMRKPDEGIFIHMINQLGISPEEAIFIDDLLVNVEGASGAGLTGFLFESNFQVIQQVNRLIRG